MATYELTLPFSADFKLFKDESKYFVDVTAADYFAAYTGSTIYVSNSGDDATGDGSLGNPYATVDAAIAAAVELDIISLEPGDYSYPSAPLTKNLAFVRTGSSGLVIFGEFYDLTGVTINSATLDGVNYFTTNQSNTGGTRISGYIRTDQLVGTEGGVYGVSASVPFAQCQELHRDGYMACYESSSSGNTSYFMGDNVTDFAALVAAGNIKAWKAENTGSFTNSEGVGLFIGNDLVLTGENSVLNVTSTTEVTVVASGAHFYSPAGSTVYIGGNVSSRLFGVTVCGSINNNIDYDGSGVGLEDSILSVNARENCSTAHSSFKVVRVGSVYFNADRPVSDTGSDVSFTLSSRIGSGNFDTDAKLIRSSVDKELYYGDIEFFGQYSVQVDDNGTITPIEEPLAGTWSFGQTAVLPTVNAGTDNTATNGDTVTLTATASNYDSLLWTCTSGQSPTFSDATVLNPTVTFNEAGLHTLQLTATNAEGSTSDSVDYDVQAIPNVGPTANAGADQSVAAGATVTLDGTGSTDSDGTIASYTWTQTSGDTVTLTGANTATPSFTAPSTNAQQTLTFQLTVTDDGGLTATDSVDVQVAAQVIESTLNATLAGIADGTYLTRVVDTDNDAVLFKGNKAWVSGAASFTLPVAVGTNVEYYAYETVNDGAGLQIGVTE